MKQTIKKIGVEGWNMNELADKINKLYEQYSIDQIQGIEYFQEQQSEKHTSEKKCKPDVEDLVEITNSVTEWVWKYGAIVTILLEEGKVNHLG